ncbi:P-loop containing nucleoside triphosphate hydrolase protein [Favolaschia claudopus]|uniref:P-loop containing nucleoside triphosphate hydrolase protein n=1 Tax=Favolaschia claudopus TaxID=2862362 RepID=A0AAW0D2X0_9AGAR
MHVPASTLTWRPLNNAFASPATSSISLQPAFYIAFGLLASRCSANQRIPPCLPRRWDLLVIMKVFFGLIYAASAIGLFVLGESEARWVLGTRVVTATAFLFTSISEHYHSLAPSTLTTLYSILATAFYAYPLLDLGNVHPVPLSFHFTAAAAASLLILVIFESTSKRDLLLPTYPPPSHEETLSFLTLPFFPTLLPILLAGARRRLLLSELHEIPRPLRADPATDLLEEALRENLNLVRASFRAFTAPFLAPILPRLVVLAMTFAQVTLVEQTILYVSAPSSNPDFSLWLVGAFFVVYTSLAISNYLYAEKINAFLVLYRSALTGSLYAKTLRLTSGAARGVGQGASTTYMSVDVGKVTAGYQTLHELWSAVLTILIACAMLWVKAGVWVMLAPLVFVGGLIWATSFVSRYVGAAQRTWLAAIDTRIKLLTSTLNHLLPIKLGAYTHPLSARVNALRMNEARALRRFLYLVGGAGTLSNIGPGAAFLVVLAVDVFVRGREGDGGGGAIDASRLFTLFTIVNILGGPLNIIGQQLPSLFASFASLERIQGFLRLPEKEVGVGESLNGHVATDHDNNNNNNDTKVEVSMKGCSFAWDDAAEVKPGVPAPATVLIPVLKDITMELVPGELHMVVGSVASGKSSLLMSILGETTRVEGSVRVRARKIALATQTPFIFPGTVRANILLDSPYDETFYDKVVHACGLTQDVEALPRKDMTKLGDKGRTLSGGPRQRLAIARAVYARADLVLLDDVFSALDGETEAHVFASLFGPEGLLKGKTTILVTHGIHHLSSADKVLVMAGGTITHFGTFEQVREAGATLALINTAAEAELTTAPGNDQLAVQKEAATASSAAQDEFIDEDEEAEMEWVNERESRMGAYAFYARCTGVWRAGSVVAFITMWSMTGIATTAFMGFLANASSHLGLWVLAYGGFVGLNLVLMGLNLAYFGYTLSTFTAPRIHEAALAGVMNSPISWITKTPVGKILNRFSQDIQVSDMEFPFAFLNFAANVLNICGTFVFIAIATPLLVIALPFLMVFGGYFLRFYLATSKQFRRLETESRSPLYTLFGTTVSGLISVRAFRAEGFFRAQNAALINASQGALHYRLLGQLFLRVFLLWFQTILACGVVILTVSLRNTTSAAFLGVALSRLVSLGLTLSHVLSSYASMENGTVSIDRIEEFAKLPAEEKNDEFVVSTDPSWPAKGSLAFQDFSVRYRGDLPLALKNLSFELPGGTKIGICGRTGSGKSSTVLSLFRGIDQHLVTGKIVVDDVDISTISLQNLRASMSIVMQDPFLWHGSIRENLDVTNERPDSEIWDVLKLVEMYDTVSALDDKLDHLVVDEESFSKGQRQLLCLARALLRNKKIIVLDESTSSMDHITDEKIRLVVDTQMQGLTVLAIAHRISSIVNYDKILVLDDGSMTEFGEPLELLKNPDSRFARLAATQGIYHPDTVPPTAAVRELTDGTVLVVATEDLVDV